MCFLAISPDFRFHLLIYLVNQLTQITGLFPPIMSPSRATLRLKSTSKTKFSLVCANASRRLGLVPQLHVHEYMLDILVADT